MPTIAVSYGTIEYTFKIDCDHFASRYSLTRFARTATYFAVSLVRRGQLQPTVDVSLATGLLDFIHLIHLEKVFRILLEISVIGMLADVAVGVQFHYLLDHDVLELLGSPPRE